MRAIIIMMLSFVSLSACAVADDAPAPAAEEGQAAVEQSVCTDTWECWCNTFTTQSSCHGAVWGGRHCYWAGPTATTATAASLGYCHATYE